MRLITPGGVNCAHKFLQFDHGSFGVENQCPAPLVNWEIATAVLAQPLRLEKALTSRFAVFVSKLLTLIELTAVAKSILFYLNPHSVASLPIFILLLVFLNPSLLVFEYYVISVGSLIRI